MTNTTCETVTDTVQRLEQAFRKGPTSKEREAVVREIVGMSSNRAAAVSLRLYQYLMPDQYLTGALCRMVEATTYEEPEDTSTYEVFDYLMNGIDGQTAKVVRRGTQQECLDFIGGSVSGRYWMTKVAK